MPTPRKIKQFVPEEQTQRIASQIRLLRKKNGLTQTMLGEKVGVTQKTIAAYESGNVRIFDITLIDLARALSVSIDELLGVKTTKTVTKDMSLRLIKRMNAIDALPEITKKHVLKVLDEIIKANKRA
jgi:transcriptional regulator with XRE-family HTH domain